ADHAPIRQLFKRMQGCVLENQYGPTETHVVTANRLCGDPDDWPVLPSIGRPIANACVRNVDSELNPVDPGMTGATGIGGICVARGYRNQPELTAERFVAERTDRENSVRMYRTGDLGRLRPNGEIEFLGRNDQHVKLRGFRVELGEVEATLAGYSGVR